MWSILNADCNRTVFYGFRPMKNTFVSSTKSINETKKHINALKSAGFMKENYFDPKKYGKPYLVRV